MKNIIYVTGNYGKYVSVKEYFEEKNIGIDFYEYDFEEIEINENCSQVALNEQLHSKKLSRIRTLEKQLSNPYFARLDFKEDGEELESFYIGLSTVEDEDNFEMLVFDWRSPVANMFYDFEVGPAYYDAPVRRISGQIDFTRQYNIKNDTEV